MSRAHVGSLRSPNDSILIADFTDGSIPSAQIITDAGSPSAAGRTYSYDSRGVMLSITGGTTGQYASFRWDPGAVIDLSRSDWLAIECDFPEGTGATLNGVAVFLVNDAGSAYSNYRNRSLASGSGKTPLRQLLLTRFSTDNWTIVGSPNLSSVRRIEIRMTVHGSSQNVPAHMFVRKVYLGRSRPKIMVTFDDMMDGQSTYALPKLEAAGFKATIFASPSVVGSAGRLSASNVDDLYDAGWDFGAQQFNDSSDIPVNFAGLSGLTSDGLGIATFSNVSSLPHGKSLGEEVTISGAASANYNLTTRILSVPNNYSFTYAISGTPTTPDLGWATTPKLSKEEAKIRFQRTLDWLKQMGYTRGNQFAAYSNGVTNEWVESWMPDLGFVLARTTRINTAPHRGMDPRCADPKALLRFPGIAMDGQTAVTILGYVDALIAYGCSAMLYGHDIDPTPATLTITESEWNAIVDGLKARSDQGLIDVITPTEFMRQLSLGRASSS